MNTLPMSKPDILHGITLLDRRDPTLDPSRRQLLLRNRLDRALKPMSTAPPGEEPADDTDKTDNADADGGVVQRLAVDGVQLRQDQGGDQEQDVDGRDRGQGQGEPAQVPFRGHKGLAAHSVPRDDGDEVRDVGADGGGRGDGGEGDGGSNHGRRDGDAEHADQQGRVHRHLPRRQLAEKRAKGQDVVARQRIRDSLRREEAARRGAGRVDPQHDEDPHGAVFADQLHQVLGPVVRVGRRDDAVKVLHAEEDDDHRGDRQDPRGEGRHPDAFGHDRGCLVGLLG